MPLDDIFSVSILNSLKLSFSAFSKVKILKKIKDHLTKVGAKYVSLSGSGSCLYGIFNIEDLDETEINFSYYSVKALT